MTYAGFGKRLLAYLLDSLVLSTAGAVFAVMYGYYFYILSFWLVGALYFILMEGGSGHATLGKKVMGIIVVDQSGEGISYGTAAARYLGKLLSAVTLFVGYLMAAFTENSQALHDKIAGTYVIDGMGKPDRYRAGKQMIGSLSSSGGGMTGRQVVGISGEFAGQAVGVASAGTMIGRDPVACQIALSASAPGVSRHHCQVDFNPGTGMFILNDLGSTYGTYLMSGMKLTSGQPAALKSGERFCVGSKANIFEVR